MPELSKQNLELRDAERAFYFLPKGFLSSSDLFPPGGGGCAYPARGKIGGPFRVAKAKAPLPCIHPQGHAFLGVFCLPSFWRGEASIESIPSVSAKVDPIASLQDDSRKEKFARSPTLHIPLSTLHTSHSTFHSQLSSKIQALTMDPIASLQDDSRKKKFARSPTLHIPPFTLNTPLSTKL